MSRLSPTDQPRVVARLDKTSWLLTKKIFFLILGHESKPIPGHSLNYPKDAAMIVVKMLAVVRQCQ